MRWLFSHLEHSATTSMLLAVAAGDGLPIRLVRPDQLSVLLDKASGAFRLLLDGDPIDPPNAALVRLGGSASEADLDRLSILEHFGVPMVNSSSCTRLSRDKSRTYMRLAAAQVPIPRTLIGGPAVHSIRWLPPPPWVVKPCVGAKGHGVAEARSEAELHALVGRYAEAGQQCIIQELIEESYGRDVRVLVLEGRAIAAMQRAAADGRLQSNLDQGGIPSPYELDDTTSRIATEAAHAVGATLAGVDLLISARGPLVCEVNASPGLQGLSRTTATDLGREVLGCLLRRPGA